MRTDYIILCAIFIEDFFTVYPFLDIYCIYTFSLVVYLLFALIVLKYLSLLCYTSFQEYKSSVFITIGERIRFFRNLRGMTQKYLGMQVGFPEKTADIRMAQYECGSKTPKADLTNSLAEVFWVSTCALTVPGIDNYNSLMYTLFTLEDRYGLTIQKGEDGVSMRVDPRKGKDATELFEMINEWAEQAEK